MVSVQNIDVFGSGFVAIHGVVGIAGGRGQPSSSGRVDKVSGRM